MVVQYVVIQTIHHEFDFNLCRFDQEKKQLLERRRQALDEYKKKKDAKRHLAGNSRLSSQQYGGEGSSSSRLFNSLPGGRGSNPQAHTPTRPAKKSSLEKRNTVKTYAEATTSSAEEKKPRADVVANSERDSMQRKVVAELATGLVNPKAQQKRTTPPLVNQASASAVGAKERLLRSGSVGANVSLLGGAQTSSSSSSSQGVGSMYKAHRMTAVDSEWTEFTGVTPKGSHIVGSSAVTNGGPATVSSGAGGGGGGGYGGGTMNSTRVDITEFDPIHKS